MVKSFSLYNINISLVFRHKWDKRSKDLDDRTFKGKWNLGLFFRRSKIVGKKDFSNPKKWSSNLVNDYMIGFNLLVISGWIEFNKGGMGFKD
jgi:hypothetical protein